MPLECFAGLKELECHVQKGIDTVKDARELLEAIDNVVEGNNRLQRRKQWTGNSSHEAMVENERRWTCTRNILILVGLESFGTTVSICFGLGVM
jgi:FtsZ-binding cell division protein ZapB